MTDNSVPTRSSQTVEWSTPRAFFDALDAEFGFTLDAAARPENAKCARFFSPDDDGLSQDWGSEVVWLNPPYGQFNVSRWMAKAYEASQRGATVVCLVPSRTDSHWWHDYAMKGEIRFVRGRLKFGGAKHNAPFANAVIVFRPPTQQTEAA